MPRLSVSLSKSMHNHLSSLAVQYDDSISSIINRLLHVGIQHLDQKQIERHPSVEQHCQQLIIQMNALIKNMSAEILKFNQEDFEKLRQAAVGKYNALIE
jgi:hypothetical protein